MDPNKLLRSSTQLLVALSSGTACFLVTGTYQDLVAALGSFPLREMQVLAGRKSKSLPAYREAWENSSKLGGREAKRPTFMPRQPKSFSQLHPFRPETQMRNCSLITCCFLCESQEGVG